MRVNTSPMSRFMHMDFSAISFGIRVSPRFIQAYVTAGFLAAICQKENFTMPGVLCLLLAHN